jgi:hypothetical protein
MEGHRKPVAKGTTDAATILGFAVCDKRGFCSDTSNFTTPCIAWDTIIISCRLASHAPASAAAESYEFADLISTQSKPFRRQDVFTRLASKKFR